ncbi:MAG: glucosylglycerol hydrolase, partial [Anaerolineae bacterium]
PGEHFSYAHPAEGTVLFYGLRQAPDGDEDLLFVANMEGAPRTVVPADLPIPNLPRSAWELALATPGARVRRVDQRATLRDSEGVVFTRHTRRKREDE